MDELLTRAGIPTDGTMYIARLMKEPYVSAALSTYIPRRYSLHVRPFFFTMVQDYSPSAKSDKREPITGEIVLASAERVPVQIIVVERVTPSPQAVKTGFWQPTDEFFSIRDTDLTPEQAAQARYFVRPYPPGVVGVLHVEGDVREQMQRDVEENT